MPYKIGIATQGGKKILLSQYQYYYQYLDINININILISNYILMENNYKRDVDTVILSMAIE